MENPRWWQEGVIYQIYPRSFADSGGDGIGDLGGITAHLDHLEWLGVDAVWITPTTASPDTDWGYDVSDYTSVHPDLGSLEDLDILITEAGDRNIRVMLDLVPNHTSADHPWFVEARSDPASPKRDYYVWADARDDGRPPNNWVSSFGGSAWTWDDQAGQWFLHNFLPTQPDLNWWNDEVRDAFDDILRFWFDRGVAGFRIDVCHMIVKDAELRDNPPAEPGDHPYVVRQGQRKVWNSERPESHDVLRRWRAMAESYDPSRVLMGETYILDVARLPAYYGSAADELQLACNFVFLHEPFTAEALAAVVDDVETHLGDPAWPVWAISTHDLPRFPTRWCGDDPVRARLALMMLLTLRGTPILYYGDELAMGDVPVTEAQRRDPVGTGVFDAGPSRDPCRTPMPWKPGHNLGFATAPDSVPWLPVGAPAEGTVDEQAAEILSPLHLTKALIVLRKDRTDLRRGPYQRLPAPPGVWAYRRGVNTAVALNLTGEIVEFDVAPGQILLGTRRGRDGDPLDDGSLRLRPWEGAVLELDPD